MVYTTPKVCLFLGRHETSASGLWTYGRNIAQGLLEAECDWDFDLICLFAGPLELEKDLLKLRKNSTRKRELYLQKLPDYFPSRRLNMLSDIILMRIESDIIHGTANLLPLFNKSVKFLTLHDLLQAFPLKSNLSRYETIRKYLYQLLLKQMISREVRIFTDRSAVQHDILKHLGTTNISVLYPPLSKEFVSKESGPITKTDSFVCFISQDRRKNIKALISALGSVNSSFVLKISCFQFLKV